MIVDMHAHVIPGGGPDGDPGRRSAGCPHIEVGSDDVRELVVGPARFRAEPVWYQAERRVEAMDDVGLDAEVVSPMPLLLAPKIPAAEERDVCRWVNEFVAGLCQAQPGRIGGFGMVPLQDPDLAAGLLAEVKQAGLRGVEIPSNVGGVSIGDERFLAFFQEAARLAVPVFVHALAPTFADRLPRAAMPSFAVTAEACLAVASMITGGTAEACPDLHMAFSHGGGGAALGLPRANWFWGRTWNEEPPPETPEGPSPLELARRFWYDGLVFDRRALQFVVDLLGHDRLLVGTDFAAMPRERPVAATARAMGLADDVVEDMCWHNCFRFLGTEPLAGVATANQTAAGQATAANRPQEVAG